MASPTEKRELSSASMMKQQVSQVLESPGIPEQGVNFEMVKGISNLFQMTYSLNFCNPNPYFGMQQGMPETLPSNWGFGGVVVGDCFNPDGSQKEEGPGMLMQFSAKPNPQSWVKFKNSEQNLMVKKSLLGGSLQWASGFNPMEGKHTLIRELTYTKAGENATWNLTMAQPEFISKKPNGDHKWAPTGVFEAGLVKKINENLIVGGSCMHRRTPPNPMMGGGNTTDATILAKFQHDDFLTFAHELPSRPKEFSDGSKSMTAKASTLAYLQMSGISPKDLTVEHHVKGGVSHSPQEFVAGLTIGKDPMPVQYGGSGGVVANGYVGFSQTLSGKPGKPKPKVSSQIPSIEEDTIIKAKLSTDGNVSTSIEGKLAPLPVSYGMKINYDMFKDKLKYGVNINFNM